MRWKTVSTAATAISKYNSKKKRKGVLPLRFFFLRGDTYIGSWLGNVLYYDSSGADHAVIADRNMIPHAGTDADPGTLADRNTSCTFCANGDMSKISYDVIMLNQRAGVYYAMLSDRGEWIDDCICRDNSAFSD